MGTFENNKVNSSQKQTLYQNRFDTFPSTNQVLKYKNSANLVQVDKWPMIRDNHPTQRNDLASHYKFDSLFSHVVEKSVQNVEDDQYIDTIVAYTLDYKANPTAVGSCPETHVLIKGIKVRSLIQGLRFRYFPWLIWAL